MIEPNRDGLSSSPLDRRAFTRRALGMAGAVLLAGRNASGQAPAPVPVQQTPGSLRVRVWSEGTAPRAVYPEDIDGAVAEDLKRRPDWTVATARLDQPSAGLADADLDATDVLIWWGRLRHDDVPDDRAAAIVERVKAGRLGLVALHASFGSKPFRQLMGMSCAPAGWRSDGRPERVAIKAPDHPMAKGVGAFTIPRASTFAEPFAVPDPETVVLESTWETGETFRSGLTWSVGQGRIAYFRPGDDSFPVMFHPAVRQIVANAAQWAARRA
jgi:trehalose utilization protein